MQKFSIIKALVVSSLLIFLQGCSTSMPPLNFAPQDVYPSKHKVDAELKLITIAIAKEEERLGDTQVGFGGNQYELSFKSGFKDALEESLTKSAVFNDMAENKVSLTAKVMKFQTPSAGMTFETDMIVRYEIYNRKDGALIFRRDVNSKGAVSGSYAFQGAIRFTEARNIAVRNNILNFISALEESKMFSKDVVQK
jgi:hypothetical protein